MKKQNKVKINNVDISKEPAQIQVARLFYRMIDVISADIIKDDNVCEEARKQIFESQMVNFDELSDKEKEMYIIAANAGWCSSMSILRTLMELQEDKNDKGDK
jgi:hypothetical protein